MEGRTDMNLQQRTENPQEGAVSDDFQFTLPDPPELGGSALDQYRELMIDIKRRSDFIHHLDLVLPHHIGWIESTCLQIRKQLENIAYACLVANAQHTPSSTKGKYNPDDILGILDAIVPDCWPEPVLANKPEPEDQKHPLDAGTIDPRPPGDWLARDELPEIYGRLGDLLHNRNPFRRSGIDVQYFVNHAPQWHEKIVRLLTKHKIATNREDAFWLVQISHDKDVTITPFVQIDPA